MKFQVCGIAMNKFYSPHLKEKIIGNPLISPRRYCQGSFPFCKSQLTQTNHEEEKL